MINPKANFWRVWAKHIEPLKKKLMTKFITLLKKAKHQRLEVQIIHKITGEPARSTECIVGK